MNQEFFTNLPSEIIINILSRLPIRNVVISKCVCKPWLNLLETPEFAKSHLSKSVPGLVVYREMATGIFNIFEFEESLELENHELHYNPVVELDQRAFINLPYGCIGIQGSANGLLFLREFNTQPNALYVCNPITREYIELPSPEWMVCSYPTIVTYGFGVSKMSGEYKVVRIYHECIRDPGTYALISIPKSEYQIYTLGTGSWRRIILDDFFEYNCRSIGVFLNGNLHWLVADLKGSSLISCLNLETELFSSFCTPTLPERSGFLGGIVVLGDCLCLCDNSSDDEIVIWLMKEYGVEKSWTKEFVISKIPNFAGESYEVVSPLKVFGDGDILMWWEHFHLFYYCNKSKTAKNLILKQEICRSLYAMLHTSSFVLLRSFMIENVNSF